MCKPTQPSLWSQLLTLLTQQRCPEQVSLLTPLNSSSLQSALMEKTICLCFLEHSPLIGQHIVDLYRLFSQETRQLIIFVWLGLGNHNCSGCSCRHAQLSCYV